MDHHLSAAELREAERQLKAQLETLAENVQRIESNVIEPSGDPDGQRADESTEDAAFERDNAALAVEDALLYEVQDALDRIAAGTYGTCEVCEQPIEKERLAVVPHARTCVLCAREGEAG